MQFVEHDPLQRRKQERRIVGRQQQRQLLGSGEQNVGRIAALPLPARHRGVAGAGLDLDRQPHLGDRCFEIARDVDGERFQRRDIEGVEAAGALDAAAGGNEVFLSTLHHGGRGRAKLHQARQKSRQRLAGAGRRDQQRRCVLARLGEAAPADARAAASRAPRTIAGSGRAAGARSRPRAMTGQGTARERAKPSRAFRRGPGSHLAPLFAGKVGASAPGAGALSPSAIVTVFVETAAHPDPLPAEGRGREAAPTPSPACRKCPSPCR